MSVAPTGGPKASPGVEVWVDAIDRDMLRAGPLAGPLADGTVRGASANPLRLAGAIGRPSYLSEFRRLVAQEADAATIARALAVSDVRAFLDAPGAGPRHASIPVPPKVARDRDALFFEADRLIHQIDRPGALVEIPATPEAISATSALIAEGVSLHLTLIFGAEQARRASEAFLKGLRERLATGKPIGDVVLFASVPIGPIADGAIGLGVPPDDRVGPHLLSISEAFVEPFRGQEWDAVARAGGRMPRIAWTALGPETASWPVASGDVIIVPAEDVFGFDANVPDSPVDPRRPHHDASLEALAPGLLERALAGFATSYDHLVEEVEARRERLEEEATTPGQTGRLGPHEDAIHDELDAMDRENAVRRFWKGTDDGATGKPPGWIDVVGLMRPHADDLAKFADEVAEEGFAHVLLIGTPEATAGPEVLRRTNIPMWGHPELVVLNSPAPATVRRFTAALDPARTLLVLADPDADSPAVSALFAHFREQIKDRLGDAAGRNLVAITRPGRPMEAEARREGFRRVFLAPADLGDRDSALAFQGLVPAALMGLDVATLLDRAEGAVDACRPWTPIEQNPAATLAATLAALARSGRDKLTLVNPAPVEAFGLWVDQVVLATGGSGLVPVVGEPLGSPAVYGADRVFVQVRTADGRDAPADSALDALADAGHPVVTHILGDTLDLAPEFFRWQAALALAASRGAGAKPRKVPASRGIPELIPIASHAGLVLAKLGAVEAPDGDGRGRFVAVLRDHLARVGPGGTVAISQYFDEREVREVDLRMIRTALRDVRKVAVTTGYGPAHSGPTGRGAADGLSIQLTADEGEDVPIPGSPFGFAALSEAQALRALVELAEAGRPAIRIHLGADADRGLAALREIVGDALAALR